MTTHTAMTANLTHDALFLVWGPPSHGPRSRVLARELGIGELHFVACTNRRGPLVAPFKYACQALRTLLLLFRKRPRTVFVQSPPSLAVLFVAVYCALSGSQYVVDAHSAAFQLPYWTRPRWLHSLLARRAVATLVTNDRFQRLIEEWGAKAFLLPDIPTRFPRAASYPVSDRFNVVVVNTFSDDEPLSEVLEAARELEDVQFYVTGKRSSAPPKLFDEAPDNVHFTDYLPEESYYALLASSQAVMCLTTRDNTMQRGACEALWLGKPIITSNWTLLREYFHQGTVHVPNTSVGIRLGVMELKKHYHRYLQEIVELQAVQHEQWQKRLVALTDLTQSALANKWVG